MNLLFILKEHPIISLFCTYCGYKVSKNLLFLYRYREFIYKNKIKSNLLIYFWNVMRLIPTIQKEINKNIKKTTEEVEQSLNKHDTFNQRTTLVKDGAQTKNIIASMKHLLKVENTIVDKNKVSGTIYSYDVDHNKLLEQV